MENKTYYWYTDTTTKQNDLNNKNASIIKLAHEICKTQKENRSKLEKQTGHNFKSDGVVNYLTRKNNFGSR